MLQQPKINEIINSYKRLQYAIMLRFVRGTCLHRREYLPCLPFRPFRLSHQTSPATRQHRLLRLITETDEVGLYAQLKLN